jgi:DNA invertase Pin-like site-specific DNA recombinase
MDNIHIARVSEIGDRLPDSLHSPRVQFKKMREWTEARGDTVLHEWDEMDVSAKLPLHKRPKLLRAVEMIEHKEAHNLVFAYFDRSVRNMRVQLEVIQRIEDGGGELWALDHGQLTNLNAVGRFSSNVIGSANQMYSDITSEKVVSALLEAIALGRYPIANVPPGYTRGPDKVLVVDEPLVPIVRGAFELRAQRASWAEIRTYLAGHGIKRSNGGVRHMLLDRVYLGELHYGEHENLHAHPGIIDPDLFALVGRTVTTGGRQATTAHLLARLGVLRCGSCGGAMVANTRAGHYRCQKNHRTPCPAPVVVNASKAEALVMDAVRAYATDTRGRASDTQRLMAADEELERTQTALDNAILAFTGMDDEPAAVKRIGELREARDVARAARTALRPNRRKVVTPLDIDSLPEAERLAEWRGLITDTGCTVTVKPATRGKVWDPARLVVEFE